MYTTLQHFSKSIIVPISITYVVLYTVVVALEDRNTWLYRDRTMVYTSKSLPECTYIGRNGICGRRCFRGICSYHINRKSLTMCLHCKVRGTTSKTGICQSIESGCRWKAQYASTMLKATVDSMDTYIDSIVDEFNAAQVAATQKSESCECFFPGCHHNRCSDPRL